MAEVAPLLKPLFEICRNGVLPTQKLVTALTCLHNAEPVYQSKEPLISWAPTMGAVIRMLTQSYRDVAKDEKAFRVCLMKAGLL